MARQIYVNLPVKDLDRSRAFFAALGFAFDERYSNREAACMVVGDASFVMLLVEPFFRGFTRKPLVDATGATEVLVCLSCASRAEVDDLVGRAIAAGGRAAREPKDHGFMYEHAFEDPDGHIWELIYMEPQAAAASA